MPNAVGAMIAKSDLKDLGIHTEMFVDSMVDMAETGVLTGARKNLDKYKIVFTFALGTQKTYDFINNNPLCATYPVNYTNDPFNIAQNDKVVAINNCVEVDLTGQVCSESRHTANKRYRRSGDFTFGAYRFRGGKAFICMSSTFGKGGNVASRIKLILTPGATVTTLRTQISYLVTEYGIVNLKGMSTWQRAEAISLAHPQFREELIKGAEQNGIWRRSNKR